MPDAQYEVAEVMDLAINVVADALHGPACNHRTGGPAECDSRAMTAVAALRDAGLLAAVPARGTPTCEPTVAELVAPDWASLLAEATEAGVDLMEPDKDGGWVAEAVGVIHRITVSQNDNRTGWLVDVSSPSGAANLPTAQAGVIGKLLLMPQLGEGPSPAPSGTNTSKESR